LDEIVPERFAGGRGAAAQRAGAVPGDCDVVLDLSDDLQTIALNIEEPSRLADFIAASLPFLTTAEKQELLETSDVKTRLEMINSYLAKELEVQQLRNKIQSEVQDSVQQSQRDFYLREQMKAIQKELGDLDETQKDVADLKEKIEAAGMPKRPRRTR
jgi:ATP-dependent Lon protease